MDKYLVVITTVLVITQVIRLIQNSISLRSRKVTDKINNAIRQENKETKRQNDEIYEMWKEIHGLIIKKWGNEQ